MRVSVICTVLNEGESIRGLLDSLVLQTRPPEEIIIVDGGSNDDTVAQIEEYESKLPIRVLVRPGANIAQGRNAAIADASGDVIASTDAGVRLEPRWLECLVAPLDPPAGLADAQTPSVSAGFFIADPRSPFELAMGATVLPASADVDPASFLPSSRSVAFRKTAWDAAGGYPEWLDYCEDLVFDFRLRDATGEFAWAPDALAHFRPRSTLSAFFRQYYRYARGDGKADLWRRRHAIRYATYLVAVPGCVVLAVVHSSWWLIPLLLGIVAYCRTPYRRLIQQLEGWTAREGLIAFLLVPVIRATGDVAKMFGYPPGIVWRRQHTDDPRLRWRSTPAQQASR